MFRFSTFQKILFFDDSYGQIVEREQGICTTILSFFFFFSKESKSEYMYARVHITERLTLKITILYLCVIHEREKVNNVIKTFLCFVINFMNVYLL